MFAMLLPAIASLVKTLATDYTTGRAAKLDYLDQAISATAVVRTIQTGEIVMTAGNASNTATLGTAVTTAKSVCLNGGARNNGGTGITDATCTVTLTNTNTVTASRDGTAGSVTVRYTILEFK